MRDFALASPRRISRCFAGWMVAIDAQAAAALKEMRSFELGKPVKCLPISG